MNKSVLILSLAILLGIATPDGNTENSFFELKDIFYLLFGALIGGFFSYYFGIRLEKKKLEMKYKFESEIRFTVKFKYCYRTKYDRRLALDVYMKNDCLRELKPKPPKVFLLSSKIALRTPLELVSNPDENKIMVVGDDIYKFSYGYDLMKTLEKVHDYFDLEKDKFVSVEIGVEGKHAHHGQVLEVFKEKPPDPVEYVFPKEKINP